MFSGLRKILPKKNLVFIFKNSTSSMLFDKLFTLIYSLYKHFYVKYNFFQILILRMKDGKRDSHHIGHRKRFEMCSSLRRHCLLIFRKTLSSLRKCWEESQSHKWHANIHEPRRKLHFSVILGKFIKCNRQNFCLPFLYYFNKLFLLIEKSRIS